MFGIDENESHNQSRAILLTVRIASSRQARRVACRPPVGDVAVPGCALPDAAGHPIAHVSRQTTVIVPTIRPARLS
jgi:hypothetical protein